jgi:hypothetical protein
MDGRRSCSAEVAKNIGPRHKMALRLWVTGAVRTQGEAAKAVGSHYGYLSLLKMNPKMQEYIRRLEREIDEKSVNMSQVMQELGRKGVQRIAQMMESEQVRDELRFRAAQDLADRSPETSKTNKLSIEGDLTLRSADAQQLMKALVEAAEVEREFRKDVESGDYIKVDEGLPSLLLPGEPSE